ncbi:hypothetical protein [Vulgatibacter incomptus]|uniref:Nucleotidyltransferase family protein n=1 Tax=Vulgatibacter incomptus TaxID=1391653 RepID=A0A0K1PCX9_9BACT|nr:hypothetical protein [Vulgatibacter incomptus]AKU90979.1 hypothetical protein AKJ08_1366 [Vulgatibacter incomptus]
MENILDVALRLGSAFERIGAGYFLGGSLASSLQGEPRATNDLDFVVDLRPDQVSALVSALGPDFEVDDEALREAAAQKSSWNIFYLPTALKIDLFIRRSGPFDEEEFTRRRAIEIRPGHRLFVKSAEDTILRKLLWFRSGGELSSTQWRDVVQVFRISGPELDGDYLARWSAALGVDDLLEKARRESED